MTDYPGESAELYEGADITGGVDDFSLYFDLRHRAGSRDLSAGDTWRVWVDWGTWYQLTDTTDAVVSWVVEVTAGSVTVDAVEGVDPDYNNTALTLTSPAGAHVLTGPGTFVIPSGFTVADVVNGPNGGDNSAMVLDLTATSGAATVQQVKLRAWPPGGAIGGLSAPYQPPATSSPVGVYVTPGVIENDTATESTALLAIDKVKQQLVGTLGGTTLDTPALQLFEETWLGATFQAQARETYDRDPPGSAFGDIGSTVLYIKRDDGDPFVPDPPGDYGIDWVYPPNEVPDDPDKWVVVGEPEWGWLQDVATIRIDPMLTYAAGQFLVGGDHVDDFPNPSDTFSELFLSSTVIASRNAYDPGLTEFSLPPIGETGLTRLVLWHAGMVTPDLLPVVMEEDDPPTGFWLYTNRAVATVEGGRYVDDLFDPILASYTAGAYRYWTLSPAVVIPLRQLHRDDGLGGTPPRAFGGASRDRTGRAYGYT